jgi:hypothetical protein
MDMTFCNNDVTARFLPQIGDAEIDLRLSR